MTESVTVIVTVKGGMVADVETPQTVRVIVRDYDTANTLFDDEVPEAKTDKDGESYFESVWERTV
jgi:hypothetical protein